MYEINWFMCATLSHWCHECFELISKLRALSECKLYKIGIKWNIMF